MFSLKLSSNFIGLASEAVVFAVALINLQNNSSLFTMTAFSLSEGCGQVETGSAAGRFPRYLFSQGCCRGQLISRSLTGITHV